MNGFQYSLLCYVTLSFFFSSRRRHTRFSRDWSSDVCSSDLSRHVAQLEEALLELSGAAGELLCQPRLTCDLGQSLGIFEEIGRASCRERVQFTEVTGSGKKKMHSEEHDIPRLA